MFSAFLHFFNQQSHYNSNIAWPKPKIFGSNKSPSSIFVNVAPGFIIFIWSLHANLFHFLGHYFYKMPFL